MPRLSLAVIFIALLAFGINADDHGMCTSPPPEDDPEASCGSSSPSSPDHDPDSDDRSNLSADQEQQVTDKHPEPLSYFIDITAVIDSKLPIWDSKEGWSHKSCVTLSSDMSKGDPCYVSKINLNVHTGTHIDMPSHFLDSEYKGGDKFADNADLESLIGPALILEVPSIFPGPGGRGVMKVGNITALILKDMLLIEEQDGLERLILKTESSRKGLLREPEFVSSYTGLTLDAAKYIVEHTNIKMIGIDYLGISTYEETPEVHKVLLSKGIVIVEGLNLVDAPEGWHNLVCLPLKISGVEGAPARCILTAAPNSFWVKEKKVVDMPDSWTPWDWGV